MRRIGLFLLAALFLFACSDKKEIFSELEEANASTYKSSVKKGLFSFQDIEDAVQALGSSLRVAEANEPLQSSWNYSEAHIYEDADGTKHCIYLFDDYEAYIHAKASCTKHYYTNDKGYLCCSGTGNTCEITTLENGGVEITTCPGDSPV